VDIRKIQEAGVQIPVADQTVAIEVIWVIFLSSGHF